MSLIKDYVFAEEPLAGAIKELHPILEKNHAETGVYDLPYNPDYDRYLALASGGHITFFSVRFHGELVGFALFFMDTEIYQKEIISATQSLNYVAKGHRGIGLAFMKFCDDLLRKQGVNSIWRQSTAKFDIGKIYDRMGYTFVEKSYLRRFP